jgi:ABC-type uncharacterized transport system permease subunit
MKYVAGIGKGTLSTVAGDVLTATVILSWLKVLTRSDYGLLALAAKLIHQLSYPLCK